MKTLKLAIPAAYRSCLKLGASSWKEDSWKGLIYRDVEYGPFDYLPDYAKYFNTVEIDQWFWSLFPMGVKMPDADVVKGYAQSVPDDFIFTIKAPNAVTLTHFYAKQTKGYAQYANQPNPHFLSLDVLKRFLDRLAPMGKKLGPVMLQFEYLNKSKMPSLDAFLEKLHEFFAKAPKGFTYAIESRNPNYLTDAFFDFLRKEKLAYVFIEGYYMPHIGDVFRDHDTFTDSVAIIRLQGPNRGGVEDVQRKEWNRIVDPQPKTLRAAAEIVRAWRKSAGVVYVQCKNHLEGSGPLTAERFLKLLKKP